MSEVLGSVNIAKTNLILNHCITDVLNQSVKFVGVVNIGEKPFNLSLLHQ
jgi:hypothetical protein